MTQLTPITFPRTIGMDLGSYPSSYCILDPFSQVLLEGEIRTTRTEVTAFLAAQPASRVVIEASSPSRWIAEASISLGHEVVVGNPREFRLIAECHDKSDRKDSRILAEFGQFRPHLLKPIQLRGVSCQIARATLSARAQLVSTRTALINMVRSYVRCLGESLPSGTAPYAFHRRMRNEVPQALRTAVDPLFDVLETIEASVKALDQEIERLGKEEFPETKLMRQVSGVGPNTSLAFAATIEDPTRFPDSRDVGPYAGLVPKSRKSGKRAPELRISKRGDADLRRLLVNAATYIIGPLGPDSDLKRFAKRLSDRGGQVARGKARIAVARKLAVLLHRLWISGRAYEPLRNANAQAA